MYYNKIIIVSVVLLFANIGIEASECDKPILYQTNNSVGLCDVTCGGTPTHPPSSNTVNCRLEFPSHSLLTFVFEQAYWVTGIGIRNTDSENLTTYSFAYTSALGTELIPLPIAALYNSSLPAGGGLAQVGRGEYQLIKFQRPIQPKSISVFGYGAFGSESCVSVDVWGCPPSSLSYPIIKPNLLQYRIPLPDNLNADSSGVQYGYLYGVRGVLNDGIEEVGSSDCSNRECFKWNSSLFPAGLSLSFSFYKPTSIITIKLFHFSTADVPIASISVYSPGTVPPYHTATQNTSLLTFEYPINTQYIQIVLNFNSTLTLTEIIFSDSNGNNVFESVVTIIDVTSQDHLTALIATSSTLLFLLLIAVCSIVVIFVIACRSFRKLSMMTRFYDTFTPESFAIYTSIKRTPKSRDYVDIARMLNQSVRKHEGLPKSSQPLPKMPELPRPLKCMSETSSLAVGDYEKVEHVLSEHESSIRIGNSARHCIPSGSAKPGLVATLSNSLSSFNRNKCTIKSGDISLNDVIIYDSTQASPSYSHSFLAADSSDLAADGSALIENMLASEHPPLSMSVSNNHLHKLAALRASPTRPKAKFQFAEDSDLGASTSAEQLAGCTLSQLNDSLSSDSV